MTLRSAQDLPKMSPRTWQNAEQTWESQGPSKSWINSSDKFLLNPAIKMAIYSQGEPTHAGLQ